MPAFSSIVRHHSHLYKEFKSGLILSYHSFRHLISGPSRLESAQSNSSPSSISVEGYHIRGSNSESSEKLKKKSKSLPLQPRFGQLETLGTLIRGGHNSSESESPKEGILVTRYIEQGLSYKLTATEDENTETWEYRKRVGSFGKPEVVVAVWKYKYGRCLISHIFL